MTYSLTQGVVKNIIPAIASTNAIIAASCCNEALKIATGVNPYLNNYMMYTGDDGIYTYTFEHQRKEDCPVCGNLAKQLEVNPSWTLEELVERFRDMAEAQVKNPSSLRTPGKTLYMKIMHSQTSGNLEKPLSELLVDGEELSVTDSAFPFTLRFLVKFR